MNDNNILDYLRRFAVGFVVTLILGIMCIGCTVSYSYSIEEIERSTSTIYEGSFAFGDIGYPLRLIRDGIDDFKDSQVYPGLYEHRDYQIHPDSEYRCLEISYLPIWIAKADSIYVQSAPDYEVKPFDGWEPVVQPGQTIIQPFVIPKDDHNPIYVQFRLRYFNLDESSLIAEVRLRLKCVPHKITDLGR